jgi:hypothetical protein
VALTAIFSQITNRCRLSSWASLHCVIKHRGWGAAWGYGPDKNARGSAEALMSSGILKITDRA